MLYREPVSSSTIAAIGYDEEREILEVEFTPKLLPPLRLFDAPRVPRPCAPPSRESSSAKQFKDCFREDRRPDGPWRIALATQFGIIDHQRSPYSWRDFFIVPPCVSLLLPSRRLVLVPYLVVCLREVFGDNERNIRRLSVWTMKY
jgi:hypothetical protein